MIGNYDLCGNDENMWFFLKISRTEGRGGIGDLTFELKLCIDIYVSTRSKCTVMFHFTDFEIEFVIRRN